MEESQKPTKPGKVSWIGAIFRRRLVEGTNSLALLGKVFSYLSADELEKLKAEEEKKIANLSTAEIGSANELDHSDAESIESQRSR